MKEFKIYSNPQGHQEAVKQGWSWPGFFFGPIWALIKKMWALGGIVLGAVIVLGAIAGESPELNMLVGIAQIVLTVIFGVQGNKWRENNLRNRGYQYNATVQAASPEGAIAAHAGRCLAGWPIPPSTDS